jgi:hypothetical protein
VLVGASMSLKISGRTKLTTQGQAELVDTFMASAYQNASTPAGWIWGDTTIKVSASDSCRMAFSSYFCMNPQILSSYSLDGSCGMSGNATFVACYSRCVHYQISCLGKSRNDASVACSASSSSSPPWNTASDDNCFCGSNFLFGASQFDMCSGKCDPISECGSCPTVPRMKTCLPLVGAALSAANRDHTTQGQAYLVDAFVSSSYSQATSAAGWSFNGQIVKIQKDSTECRIAFSSYFCMHPSIMQTFELNGSCGLTPPAAFVPCLQRCVEYQISCLGAASISAATSACTAPPNGSALAPNSSAPGHTFSNANCFCGNNFPYGGDLFDSCAGPCNPVSECGTCPTVTSMAGCVVLLGTALSSSSTTSYTQAQALQIDAFIASAYANATSDAGWEHDSQSYKFADSDACRTAFSSYFCLSPSILSAFLLNGSCGVKPPATFTICPKRCTAFQTSCLGRGPTSSSSACKPLADAGVITQSNTDCFCSDSRPASIIPSVCSGRCPKPSECSRGTLSAGPVPVEGALAAGLVLVVAAALLSATF